MTLKNKEFIWLIAQTRLEQQILKTMTKILIEEAVDLTTLIYQSETLVTYRGHIRLLGWFHQRCHRTIFNIYWSDFVTNVEILELDEIFRFEAILMKYHLRWTGPFLNGICDKKSHITYHFNRLCWSDIAVDRGAIFPASLCCRSGRFPFNHNVLRGLRHLLTANYSMKL